MDPTWGNSPTIASRIRIRRACDGGALITTSHHPHLLSHISHINTTKPPISLLFILFSLALQFFIMSSIVQSLQKRIPTMPTAHQGGALPVSNGASLDHAPALRRRLSSLSLKLQPISSPATTWALQRSKSVSAMGEYAGGSVKRWWDWGWTWVLSRKPIFAQDLEMNEEETKIIGSDNRGSWRHVFFKVRSELRKLMSSDNVTTLPQTYRPYDSLNYPKTKK